MPFDDFPHFQASLRILNASPAYVVTVNVAVPVREIRLLAVRPAKGKCRFLQRLFA